MDERLITRADSVSALLFERAGQFPEHDLFVLPPRVRDLWKVTQARWSYRETADIAAALAAQYKAAGYGPGHRVALLLENRPEHFFHFLALNFVGAGIVPLNPDYKPDELHYALEHSESAAAIVLPHRREQVDAVAKTVGVPVAVHGEALPPPRIAAPGGPAGKPAEAALLYTSGTTGRPKGCMLSNDYFLGWGEWYVAQGGLVSLRPGVERLMQPLPTFHTNATGNSFLGMLMAGGAQVILDRFHPRSWWQDAVDSAATCFHFLGVMPAMLLGLPPSPLDRAHTLRYGMGGGLHKTHHAQFEQRFGVPLLEGWAMTETGGGGLITDSVEPRRIGTQCMGHPDRPGPPMELRVIDDAGREVGPGEVGEMQVRARGVDPRRRFFSGYLKDPAATEAAWKGGWLNSGDLVRRDEAGYVYFVDRKKSIIRRSGENIAGAEVEGMVAAHPGVQEVAVLAVSDEIRGEEVMAIVVPALGAKPDADLAEAIFAHCSEKFAYYKAPGYIAFVNEMPTTSTQKIRKADLGDLAENPTRHSNCFDLRARKQQRKPARTA
ncbi:MAG: AMP-binding protein [Rhodospirillaceae bacterium]|nr:AMP-binding protein [Rhodospirillaceae bacterium]